MRVAVVILVMADGLWLMVMVNGGFCDQSGEVRRRFCHVSRRRHSKTTGIIETVRFLKIAVVQLSVDEVFRNERLRSLPNRRLCENVAA